MLADPLTKSTTGIKMNRFTNLIFTDKKKKKIKKYIYI